MARNRSGKDEWRDRVEGHSARSRLWAPCRIDFTAKEREDLAESANLDAGTTRGEHFVDAVATLCGSLPNRTQAVDVGRPGVPMRDELQALEGALRRLLGAAGEVSDCMLQLSSAAQEQLAGVLGGSEPTEPHALWELRNRVHAGVSPLWLNRGSLSELADAAKAAADEAPGQRGGRPSERAKKDTIKELAAVFQLMHNWPSHEEGKPLVYFFARLRPLLDDGKCGLAPEPTDLEPTYRWCRTHRVPPLQERLSLDAGALENRLRQLSPAFTGDWLVSATGFDSKHTAQVNALLASARRNPPETE